MPQPLWYFCARSTWTGHRHNTYITLHRHVTSRCSRHVPSRHVTSLHVSSRLVPLPGSRFEVPLYIMSRHVTSRSQVPVSRYLLSRTFLGRDTTTCGDAVLRPPLALSLVAVAEPLDPLQVQVQAFGALHLENNFNLIRGVLAAVLPIWTFQIRPSEFYGLILNT